MSNGDSDPLNEKLKKIAENADNDEDNWYSDI